MAIGANAHHSAYLQNSSFLRAWRLLMHDLDEPSDEAVEGFLRTDLDTEPASLNVRPDTLQEEAGQEASDELPPEYDRSAAAVSSVDYGYVVPTWCMVPTYSPLGLGPPACNLVYRGENPQHAHPPVVESSIFFWRL